MKSYIITGAGSGLGKELAILLAEKKYHVILTGRTIDKLDRVKDLIEKSGGKATSLALDVRSPEDIYEKLHETVLQGTIYGLINNAGIGYFGPFTQSSSQETADMFNTNVFGTLNMTKVILPFLLKNNKGHIMNIISTAGLRGKANEAVYATTKFAVRGFTESLQKEYEATNIHISAVYMGGMSTPFWEGSDHISDPSRLRSPKEVAERIIDDFFNDKIIIETKNMTN